MFRTVCLVLVAVAAAQDEGEPQVVTTYGIVQGTRHADEGYSSFTGIRYALAPTGRNRFGSALPPPSWDDIFEANRNDISCHQIELIAFIGSNDCLTLNIYTPDVATPQNPVAVMVYFHGGGAIMGSVILYRGDFLIGHDVVIVLVNFRINALGNLCLRHESIPGNAGFKDQVAALRWIQQNIRSFGGDPDNVTIMGHSGGAISVELHTLSPISQGLLHKAIGVSASALAFWAVLPHPVNQAMTMAQRYLGYDGNTIEDLVEFYLNVDDEALTRATTQFYSDLQHMEMPVAACVEEILPGIEPFLTDSPINILKSGQYTPVPKIYGVANKEYVSAISSTEVENVENLMQNLEELLPTDLVFQSDQQRTEITNRVHEFYVKERMSILESYIDFKSDTMFYHSITRAARESQSTSNASIYLFDFSYESYRRIPRLPETLGITGAGHMDDVFYVMRPTETDLPISNEDRIIIERYTKLLTNFAKYSNPTPDVNELQWPPLTPTQFPYLQLDVEVLIFQSPNALAIELWDQIYTELNKPHVQTEQGLVRGTHFPDTRYSSFTGIRYGIVPSGRGRYLIEVDTFIGSNDCLTLNIYTPDVATPENLMAVMVYFYGGGAIGGSVISYSEDFLMEHDVVVVLVNFRVNALGNLCLRHELIPGNAGFKDQVAALSWLQQNIRAFGGDPDNVTIMGHSGGAISVELLTLSPIAQGLFHKAIGVSASALSFWAIHPDPVNHAITMAQRHLGYDGDSFEDLVEFYLNVDFEALALATTQFYSDLQHMAMPVTPCVEEILPGIEPFLTDSPINILKSGQYTPVPKIYGVTNNEYVSVLSSSEVENVENLMQNLKELLPTDLVFQSDQQRTEITNRVHDFYVNDGTSILESYIAFKSDTMFYHSITRAARESQSTSNAHIYLFEFSYESYRRSPRLPETLGITGVAHSDDVLFVINPTQMGIPISDEDRVIIDQYTKLLTNFAKYGNPTPQNAPVDWLPLTEDQLHYLELGSQLRVSHSPNAAAVALWDEIYAAGTSARILPSLFALVLSTLLLFFNLH